MFSRILEFIEHHYLLSICTLILLCATGVGFAASPDIFKYIFSSEETITSVDNSLLLSTDLDHMDANVKINSVKVDDDSYSIDYTHDTLDLDDGFWRKVGIDKSIIIDKNSLVEGQNVGAYAAQKLIDDINRELAALKKIQEQEKLKGATQKVVTTTYSGIVGSLISSTEEIVEDNSSNTSTGGTSGGSGTSTTTPPTTSQETLAELINDLIDEALNPSPTPNPNPSGTPSAVADPNPTSTPNPTPTPTPTPVVLPPTPVSPVTPNPSPTPNPIQTSGYMYMPFYPPVVEGPDIADTELLLE